METAKVTDSEGVEVGAPQAAPCLSARSSACRRRRLTPTTTVVATRVTQTNLVANRDGFGATIVDPDLLNAWGCRSSDVAGVGVEQPQRHVDAVPRRLGGRPSAVAKIGLTVSMDGPPTGQVANATTRFKLANATAALFIFATEDGQIFAWNQPAGTTAEQDAMVDGANFKGLAQGTVGTARFLYAADFANGSIDVFDDGWTMEDWPGAFHVRHLPKGFSPFNVQVLTDPNGRQHVFVAYASSTRRRGDEVAGRGLGLVAEFTHRRPVHPPLREQLDERPVGPGLRAR